jgi:alpha-tubulin suppressor-like RCC1 family protein
MTPPGVDFTDLAVIGTAACALHGITSKIECWGSPFLANPVPTQTTFDSIAGGVGNLCGIDTGGMVECWAGNWSTPIPASLMLQIDLGLGYACGVTQPGPIECWGTDTVGQATPPPGDFDAVAAGITHTCGIRSVTGLVECWGFDLFGEGSPPVGTAFTQVSVGSFHSCGITTGGTVECWGLAPYSNVP